MVRRDSAWTEWATTPHDNTGYVYAPKLAVPETAETAKAEREHSILGKGGRGMNRQVQLYRQRNRTW
jgi:hypothetical protein